MKILVDAMGGDNAPEAIVKGALTAAFKLDLNICLFGRSDDIMQCLEKEGINKLPDNIEIVNTTEVIEFDEDPVKAIRNKKDSSMTVGLHALRDGKGDAFISAGSTGALLTGATLIVKRVKGIRRAAMAPFMPSKSGGFLLIDCGANAECTPEYLLQFAYMGSFYAEDALEIKKPRIGLLNNGTEETKGTPLQLETHELLKKTELNYIGNIEAKEVLKGGCDVIVCDGFTGNVMLKTIEGTASFILGEFKDVFKSNLFTMLGYLLIKGKMTGLKKKMDPDVIGGTALLGISKPVIKAHGSSGEQAIFHAIKRAHKEVNLGISERLQNSMQQMKITLDITSDNT